MGEQPMETPAQIRANRANAQRSSGPRSEAGREITKMNALKHGLAARELVIRDEDPAALDALRADLRAEHAPANQTEALLVEDLAICWWRLQRGREILVPRASVDEVIAQFDMERSICGVGRASAPAQGLLVPLCRLAQR